MSRVNISMEIRLDADGFVRRACPHCRREFKWLATQSTGSPSPARVFCPYCGQSAPPDQWWTAAQVEYAKALAMTEVVGPALEKLARDLKRLNRPGSLVRIETRYRPPRRPTPPAEPNDMRKVTPPCHPEEPFKVHEGWRGVVHCLLCGRPFSDTSLDQPDE